MRGMWPSLLVYGGMIAGLPLLAYAAGCEQPRDTADAGASELPTPTELEITWTVRGKPAAEGCAELSGASVEIVATDIVTVDCAVGRVVMAVPSSFDATLKDSTGGLQAVSCRAESGEICGGHVIDQVGTRLIARVDFLPAPPVDAGPPPPPAPGGTFHRAIPSPGDASSSPPVRGIVATPNGALVLRSHGATIQSSELLDFDRTGKVRSGTSFGVALYVLARGNNGAVIAAGERDIGSGRELVLVKLTASGQITWKMAYPNAKHTPIQVVALPSGGYAVLAQVGIGPTNAALIDDVALFRVDEDGVPTGLTYVGGTGAFQGAGLARGVDGVFWIAATHMAPSTEQSLAVLTVDATGASATAKVYGANTYAEQGRAIVAQPSGGATMLGRGDSAAGASLFAMRFAADGTLASQKRVPLAGTILGSSNAAVRVVDGTIVTIDDFESGSFLQKMIKLDDTGAVTWARTINDAPFELSTSALAVDDAGFFWLGGRRGSEAALLRMDGNGAIAASCPAGLVTPLSATAQDTALTELQSGSATVETATPLYTTATMSVSSMTPTVNAVCGP